MAIVMRRWAAALVPLFVAGSLVAAPVRADAPAGDAARGKKLAYTCYGCHGIPDYRNAYPDYRVPRLGGQHANYLTAALAEYRAGTRSHPTMKGQASSLSEQDARDIAAYFSGLTPPAGAGKGTGAMPDAAKTCTACHGADGVGATPDYPTLAGQYADYLEQALRSYRKGTRENPIMGGFVATLREEDLAPLARYFAAQQPGLSVPLPPSKP